MQCVVKHRLMHRGVGPTHHIGKKVVDRRPGSEINLETHASCLVMMSKRDASSIILIGISID
jgi:hypothetical protein